MEPPPAAGAVELSTDSRLTCAIANPAVRSAGKGGAVSVDDTPVTPAEEVADSSLNGQVVEHLRPGFEYGELLLEKERVCVRVLVQPTASLEP